MAEVIRMPLLSDTMTEGKIVSWNKAVGDKVKADDPLCDVETDKATMEVVGYVDGTLLYIGVEAGKAAKVNEIIAVVGKEGEDYKSLLEGKPTTDNGQPTAAAPAKEDVAPKKEASTEQKPATDNQQQTTGSKVELPAGAKEIRMPLLSDTMTEGKIISWNKAVGDKVKADDPLCDVETDKATMEVVGYEEGTLLYIGVEAGNAAKVNEIIAIVGKEGTDVSAFVAAEKSGANAGSGTSDNRPQTTESSAVAEDSNKAESDNTEPATDNTKQEADRIKASPLAKKLAEDKGINLSQVKGSGDNGRITKKDIDSFVPDAKPAVAAESKPADKANAPVAAFVPAGQEGHTDIELTQMRKVIARRLGESKFSAPHFYLTMEINMDNAIAARVAMNEVSPVKISFNDMTIKACAAALRQHPAVNSSWMGEFIRQNHHIHIGSAVAMPEGLIVPVIRFADQKSLSQIAADAKQLYAKAKDKKLQPNEFSGNTFTISNLGMMDIEEFTAIINPPDSAILAVGRIKEVVVKKGDGFGVTNVMKVTLSCDHRSVDGAVGAAFLQTLKKYMENPVTMLV